MTSSHTGRAVSARRVLWLAIAVAVSAGAVARAHESASRARDAEKSGHVPLVVSNCDDSGPGSVRDAIANAVDGDTIDLTGLACSTITLTSGALAMPQDSLSIAGPGVARLSISGNDQQPVFMHYGYGALAIADLDVEHGLNRQQYAFGGCVLSNGHITLARVSVHGCTAEGIGAQGAAAEGGGVFAQFGIEATDARIYANATATPDLAFANDGGGGLASSRPIVLTGSYVGGNHASACGGIDARYGLHMRDTTVAGNSASGTGGVCAISELTDDSSVDIESSAIIDNTSNVVGGLWLYSTPPPAPAMRLVNSTVSGNTSTAFVGSYGGIYTRYGALEIVNSTIAFNRVESGEAAGLFAIRDEVHLQSSIIANNTSLAGSASPYITDFDGFMTTIDGASNLVTVSRLAMPVGTLAADPMLLPLAYNGGRTKTHALAAASPAVDAGSNTALLPWDQRGAGYPREVGAGPDIGAFELDADHVFAGSFEG